MGDANDVKLLAALAKMGRQFDAPLVTLWAKENAEVGVAVEFLRAPFRRGRRKFTEGDYERIRRWLIRVDLLNIGGMRLRRDARGVCRIEGTGE